MDDDPNIAAHDSTSTTPAPPYELGDEVWVGYRQMPKTMRRGVVNAIDPYGHSAGTPLFRVHVKCETAPDYVIQVTSDGAAADPLFYIGREPYATLPELGAERPDRDPELDSYDVAVVVFARVQGADAGDAHSVAEMAVRQQLSGDLRGPNRFPMRPLRWSRGADEHVRAVDVKDVRGLRSAASSLMLTVEATDRAYR